MVRLSEDDSPARVEDATERHMRLCSQVKGGDKYRSLILPFYNDMVESRSSLDSLKKQVVASQDTIILRDSFLDDLIRDAQGRVKEFDRKNPGSNLLSLIFPGGIITPVITMPYHDEPATAHGIAMKIRSLGETHTLYPLAAEIDEAVEDCNLALKAEEGAIRAEGEGNIQLTLTKIKLVRQYNNNYFIAGNDVDKNYAEKLFPKLRNTGKKEDDTDPGDSKPV